MKIYPDHQALAGVCSSPAITLLVSVSHVFRVIFKTTINSFSKQKKKFCKKVKYIDDKLNVRSSVIKNVSNAVCHVKQNIFTSKTKYCLSGKCGALLLPVIVVAFV